MRLPASSKISPSKLAPNGEFKIGDMNLPEVHIHHSRAMHPGHLSLIDDRKLQLHCERTINAAFGRSCVHKSAKILAGKRRPRIAAWMESGVEPDIDDQSGPVENEPATSR